MCGGLVVSICRAAGPALSLVAWDAHAAVRSCHRWVAASHTYRRRLAVPRVFCGGANGRGWCASRAQCGKDGAACGRFPDGASDARVLRACTLCITVHILVPQRIAPELLRP